MKLLWALCGVILVGQCRASEDESVARLVVGTFMNCLESDMSLCLKEHALKATQRLRTVKKLKITGDLVLVNNGYKEARSLEPLSSELELRKQQVSQRLWDSASDILRNSDLEYNFADDDDDEEESRAIGDEARGKKKKKQKKKLIISLAILGKIKAIILTVAFLGVIAASIFKIATILKIAFIVKAIAILKALLQKKKEHEEHTWVAHEEPSHGGGGGWDQASSGWSRSRNEAQNLAYSAYNN